MADKAPAKRRTRKKAEPAPVVVVRRQPLTDQLHPGIYKAAMEHARGDARRVEVISPTHAAVRM